MFNADSCLIYGVRVAVDEEMRQARSEGQGWTRPRLINCIEWFASAIDLRRLMADVKSDVVADKELAEVLSDNTLVPFDSSLWPFVGDKGGSEQGVLNMSWLMRRDDHRWFVLTLGLNDTPKNHSRI